MRSRTLFPALALGTAFFACAEVPAQTSRTTAELSFSANLQLPAGSFKTSDAFDYALNVVGPGGGFGTEFSVCFGGHWLAGFGAGINVFSFDHERQARILQAHYAWPGTTIRRMGIDPIRTPGNHALVLHAGYRLSAGRWKVDGVVGAGLATYPSLGQAIVWRKTMGSNAIDTITITAKNYDADPAFYLQQTGSLRLSYSVSTQTIIRVGATYTTGRRSFSATERISPLFGDANEREISFHNRISTIGIWAGIVLQFEDFEADEAP